MKRSSLFIIGGAAMLAMPPIWTSALTAGSNAAAAPPGAGHPPLDFALNRACVVTLDTRGEPKEPYPGDSTKISGLVAPDTVEGMLIGLDSEWLVLRDGIDENWIPRNKVLMMRVSR